MTACFSLLEKTSNATLCLVIKDMEKLERESGFQDTEVLTMREDCSRLH